MSKKQVLITDRAYNAFRRIVQQVKTTSLIGAEEARTTILNRIRKICSNPAHGSREANFETLQGEYRSALAWNYRIYYKVEEDRLIVLDMIIDENVATPEI
ncbi:MAG: type II toxin-antitoxin system RelE/ParE family toxin [Flavobacteriales bacterium]|nr:type II toxin-antitoxin system RelE/ParE family toxin [Flavobacteriales bacterium]